MAEIPPMKMQELQTAQNALEDARYELSRVLKICRWFQAVLVFGGVLLAFAASTPWWFLMSPGQTTSVVVPGAALICVGLCGVGACFENNRIFELRQQVRWAERDYYIVLDRI